MTIEMKWDPKNVELTGYIRSTDEVSTSHFIQQVRRYRDNDFHRDCMQYESEFALISIGDGFVEQDKDEIIVSSVNVWNTESKPSTNAVVREEHELVRHTRYSQISPELISHLFGVGIPKSKEMIQKTTQRGLCQSIHPLTRTYIVDQLDPHINELAGKWTLDHLESRVKSINGNLGAFVFITGNVLKHTPKLANIRLRMLINCNDYLLMSAYQLN